MVLKKFLEEILDRYQITADHIVIIESIFEKDMMFLEKFLQIEKQRKLLLQNLVRRGFLDIFDEDIGFELSHNIYVTSLGEEILLNVKEIFEEFKKQEVVFMKTEFESQFEEFWSTFPSTDKFGIYPTTRNLRTNQDKCKRMYKKLLEDYKHEDIMKALLHEIEMRKNNSVGKSFSDFKYMKASSTWLHNKEFLAILEGIENDSIEKRDIFSKDI